MPTRNWNPQILYPSIHVITRVTPPYYQYFAELSSQLGISVILEESSCIISEIFWSCGSFRIISPFFPPSMCYFETKGKNMQAWIWSLCSSMHTSCKETAGHGRCALEKFTDTSRFELFLSCSNSSWVRWLPALFMTTGARGHFQELEALNKDYGSVCFCFLLGLLGFLKLFNF